VETVTLERTIDAPPEAVRGAMADLEAFTAAAGFDEVSVDGDLISVANAVGPVEIELELRLLDEPDAEVAYEQVEGIFESMTTTYAVRDIEGGTSVSATTSFALDVAVVGGFLDSTVIRRQRRAELRAQFDYLEREAAG